MNYDLSTFKSTIESILHDFHFIPIMIIVLTLFVVSVILAIFLLRFRQTMATLITWLIGNFSGAQNTEDQDSNKRTPDKQTKPKKKPVNKKHKPSLEPSFSTTSERPIEEVIEETIAEDISVKPKKRYRKPTKSTKVVEETVGFSFFKSKSTEHLHTLQHVDEPITKRKTALEHPNLKTTSVDDLGFSFLPLKKKKPSKLVELPKSALIQHFKPSKKKPETKKSPLKEDYSNNKVIDETQSQDKGNFIEIKNRKSGRVVYLECKESKKVQPTISFASVVKNLDEIKDESSNDVKKVSIEESQSNSYKTESVESRKSLEFKLVDDYFGSTNFSQSNQIIPTTHSESIIDNYILDERAEEIVRETITENDTESDVVTNTEFCQKVIEDNAFGTVSEIDVIESFNLNVDNSVCREEATDFEILNAQFSDSEISTKDIQQFSQQLFTEQEKNAEYQLTTATETTYLSAEEKLQKINLIEEEIKYTEHNSNIESTNELIFGIEEIANEESEEITPSDLFQVEEIAENSVPLEATGSVTQENIQFEYQPPKMGAGQQVRILTLNDQEHQESTLYRIEENWIIQFRLGPSLLGRKVNLYCNYPKDGQFNRSTYQLLSWCQEKGCDHSDDTALLTEIVAKIAGSFHYYLTYENAKTPGHQGSGFFLVDPILKYGNNEDLPLDCIQCQTVLSKSLGTFNTWENKLKVAKESGYNMIHFTPIQELGKSNSSYSLSEQLKTNHIFGNKTSFNDIEKFLAKIRKEWKMTSICDIVLNHTANESEWLQKHPEATYNCSNCPYLRPAYLLDAALHQFSVDVTKGLYETKGIPSEDINCEDHLNSIRYHLQNEVLTKVKIHEMFICDTNKYLVKFLSLARNKVPPIVPEIETDELKVVQDPEFRRLNATIDMNLALKVYNIYRTDCYDEDSRIKRCSEEFKNKLNSLNQKIIDEVNNHLNSAVENCIAGIRYFRVQGDGPKIKEISMKNPLVYRYFTDYRSPKSIEDFEEIMYGENSKFLMAHNGWVMNADPLKNFAASDSNVYLRRELIAWGDSVKLRFGNKPADSPFLWDHMRQYVEQTAKMFDGVRLDNCHSTPIPVAEYLLDCARKVRPNLYVVAELFTNSDHTDNIFVNRLGITSLIREAMSAWDSHEQGRLVYRYGGCPVGSFYQPSARPLVPSVAHALFLDLTHDNPSPVEKRSVFDLLPSTALVNMACCASGSNRGYDELVPHHIHVVDETREYTEWTDDENMAMGNLRYVTKKSGIIAAKKALNDLHSTLGAKGFDQVYVDQIDPDIVAVTRHCPGTHQSYILIAFTAFPHPPEHAARYQRPIKPLRVEGVLDEIVLEASLSHISAKKQGNKYVKFEQFLKDNKWINGLSEYQVFLKQHIQLNESDVFEKVDSGTVDTIQLNFNNFKPGSIAVIKVSLPENMRKSIEKVRNVIGQFPMKETELRKIIGKMGLADLNRALYRCDQEERNEGYGSDTYDIPNYGKLEYAGFQGFLSLLSNIRANNDLGHPMCGNLRDGNWMIDYTWQRLKLDDGTKELGMWIEENMKLLKAIPRYLIPCYFDVIVTGIHQLLLEHSFNSMSQFVKNGSAFVKSLSLGSLQFAAQIKTADLPELSPNLAAPKPPKKKNSKRELVQACVSLSAGLPHFSVGYMRNWGRDTFIALRGLFLLTDRHQDARYTILAYAACLRHGLIPNLLDGGRNPRYNCRDAIWWWAYCIKCYVEDVPNGIAILSDKVSRIFPEDDSPAQRAGVVDQKLCDVLQEALKVHFQGLLFRERNAGRQIDEHMTDKGFNNQIGIHPETGFVFGGNEANCGTWMDKMGSSDKAGNRGKPATPRDGSAVELIGLSKAVVSWLGNLNRKGLYPYDGVERIHKNGTITKWTFIEWANKIQSNFERYFWVNAAPKDGEIRPDLINKRAIYKDSHGATQPWTDFQLRCNFPIAMVAAPELFHPQHAWEALNNAEKYLLGPLGMKTLDPDDWAYNGDYDNANDSDNTNIANGFNYHQGPEWVWPIGYYLRAKLHFAAKVGELKRTVADTKVVLSKHFTELQTSLWRGLPELTNKNGAYCPDSSRTQAWSMSAIIEVLHDLQKIEAENPTILN